MMQNLAVPPPAAREAHVFRREGPTQQFLSGIAAAGAGVAVERGMRSKPTATLLAKLKKQAKLVARDGKAAHGEELDRLAIQEGYPSWRALAAAVSQPSDSLPVDPDLPAHFDNTPNEERPKAQIDKWWDKPFACSLPGGRFEVRCLDGGAWDRSTSYGVADSLEQAQALAILKLDRWQAARATPVSMLTEGGMGLAVQMPQRPGEKTVILAGPMPMAQLNAWIEEWRRQQPALAI